MYWNLLLFELSAALLYVQDYLVGKKEAAELPSASEWWCVVVSSGSQAIHAVKWCVLNT